VNRKRLALLGLMAGMSIATPYALAVAAGKWPNSFVGRANARLHQVESPHG